MVGNNGQPIHHDNLGRPVYIGVCDVEGCGVECVRVTFPRMAIDAPAEWIAEYADGRPQRCNDHPLETPPPPPPPPPPVPETITPAQVRIAAMIVLNLPNAEALDQIVEGVIVSAEAGLSSQEQEIARIKWQHATIIERGHPLIAAVALYLGVGSEVIDEVFRVGALV